MIARLTKQLKVEEQVEESKEPEKVEATSVEEEEPCRTEEDREVKNHLKIYFTDILIAILNCAHSFHFNIVTN